MKNQLARGQALPLLNEKLQEPKPGSIVSKDLVLFIHGLGGKSGETWGDFKTLIEYDNDISEKVDVGFFDFPTALWSRPFGIKPIKIQELADSLKTTVSLKYDHYQRIIFVAHSLGGLVAQRYIIDTLNYNRKNQVTDIILFGTPNFGSKLAIFANLLSFRNWQIRQLMPNSEVLIEISKDWDRLQCDTKFKTLYVVGGQDSVVERSSASRVKGIATETIADKGHIDLVKPSSREDLSYLIVKRAIQGSDFRGEHKRNPIIAISEQKAGKDPAKVGRHKSLFERYTSSAEQYYIIRREDTIVSKYMDFQNLWIWGPSGYGKTTILIRALSISKKNYRLVSLGHYAGGSARDVFRGLLQELASLCDASPSDSLEWPDIISEACTYVDTLTNEGCQWIMVEEIPFRDGEEYVLFISKIMIFISSVAERSPDNDMGFLFSSIEDPTKSIVNLPKMQSMLKVLQLKHWRSFDAKGLIYCIETDTSLHLTDEQANELLRLSNNSPRMIKIFFINFMSLKSMGGSYQDVIDDTFLGIIR